MSKWYKATREGITSHEIRETKHSVVYICPYSGVSISASKRSKSMGWFPTLEEAKKFRMDLLIKEENKLYLQIADLQQKILDIEALKDE
jgi:hypothetical protein